MPRVSFLEVFVIVGIAAMVGVLVYNDARRAGMPSWWAVVSVLLFPVGLVAYAVARQFSPGRRTA